MEQIRVSKEFETFIHGFAGATAGTLSILILYPLENMFYRKKFFHFDFMIIIYKNKNASGIG